ncbi:MAG: hypothetical protein WCD70_07810 [Alphaproteobacteria bacterium]
MVTHLTGQQLNKALDGFGLPAMHASLEGNGAIPANSLRTHLMGSTQHTTPSVGRGMRAPGSP